MFKNKRSLEHDKENFNFKKIKEDYYGLPINIKELLEEENNYEKLNEYQLKVLEELKFQKNNLILYVPKNGGLNYVLEIFILKELLINKKNVLYILPYYTTINEKIKIFEKFSFDFVIEEYAKDKGILPPSKKINQNTLFVATIEKAYLLMIYLLKEKRLNEIGLIVFDELNILNDNSNRSSFIEAIFSLCCVSKQEKIFNSRIVMISSTLNNFNSVSVLMNVKNGNYSVKPKEIKETICIGNKIEEYIKNKKTLIPYKTLSKKNYNDIEVLTELINQKAFKNLIKVFCPTKEDCRKITNLLTDTLNVNFLIYKADEKKKVLDELEDVKLGEICPILKKSIPYGIAYLNTDLTSKEREIIENSYKNNVLCCVISTLILSGNINSYANYIIIKGPYVANRFITYNQYKLMTGRTGLFLKKRESIMLTKTSDYARVKKVLDNDENLHSKSSFHENNIGLCRIILSLIYSNLITTKKNLIDKIKCHTLFGIESVLDENFLQIINDNIQKLIKFKLVKKIKKNDDEKILITKLGESIVTSLIDIDYCEKIYIEFKKFSQKIRLNSVFHFLYICTSLTKEEELPRYPNSHYLSEMFFKLSKDEKDAAYSLGFTEYLLIKYQTISIPNEKIKRLYLILIVYDTWINKNLNNEHCKTSKGNLEKILKTIDTNYLSIISYVEKLDEFLEIKKLLNNFDLKS